MIAEQLDRPVDLVISDRLAHCFLIQQSPSGTGYRLGVFVELVKFFLGGIGIDVRAFDSNTVTLPLERQFLGQRLSNLLTQGIPSLPPRKVIRTFFDSAIERNDSGLPDRYDVIVTYKDSA